jgi:hypothetical protein
MARLTVSFKNTEKDKKLYDYWDNLEDRSAEIKKILRIEMDKREGNKETTKNKKESINEVDNILNF